MRAPPVSLPTRTTSLRSRTRELGSDDLFVGVGEGGVMAAADSDELRVEGSLGSFHGGRGKC